MSTPTQATMPQCCLCGNWLQFGAKALYGYQVCPKCYNDFAWKRAFAYIIDIVIVNVVVGILIVVALIVGVIVVGAAGEHNDAAATAGGMIIILGYLGSFLMAYVLIILRDGHQGMSPGKRVLGLKVIHSINGLPAGWGDSFKRNIILAVPVVPIVVIVQIFTSNGLRLGDEWSHMKVIWTQYADRAPFLSMTALEAQVRRARQAAAQVTKPAAT